MQSEVDSLKQRISELEAEKAELEAKNAELLKQVTEESTKREAENFELKARIAKLEQTAEENTELKNRITKLEQKQTQAITNKQEPSSTKDISPPYLKAYSANSISELTNDQIQKIIDNISDYNESNMPQGGAPKGPENHMSEWNFDDGPSPKSFKTSEESISSTPQLKKTLTEKQNNPTHDHAYFRNKTLLRYSDLYKTFITEKFDYYDIIEGSLCPVCKLNHEDGKSVKVDMKLEPILLYVESMKSR
ncbi:1701_t:CDS:2 [Acaulospora colombiana]|uniref:1701_t:CDS:1 n=1 Tax=Acaulospora colombiana TaxID=27376 RepID=A0ACA9JWF5_9GLOM|nr:1701_t:CDS:2 [Acaulospora colombiana]